MSIFEKSFRKDLETFEYDKRNLLQDHKWDRLKDGEETKKFYEAKERIYFRRVEIAKDNIVQSNPETTGQHGTMV